MDLQEIRALLEKFYKGETSLNEEKILREYFSTELVNSEFTADKDIFLYQIYESDKLKNIPDISNEILDNLKGIDSHKLKTNNRLVYVSLRIAASIIILFGSYLLLKNQVLDKQDIQFADTYDDPELAYQQAKEALMYVSIVFNCGAEHLDPIAKMDEGTQKLSNLLYINKGKKELDPINTYNLANKYFKQ